MNPETWEPAKTYAVGDVVTVLAREPWWRRALRRVGFVRRPSRRMVGRVVALPGLPSAPTPLDPATFDARADAFLAALPDLIEEANRRVIATAEHAEAISWIVREALESYP